MDEAEEIRDLGKIRLSQLVQFAAVILCLSVIALAVVNLQWTREQAKDRAHERLMQAANAAEVDINRLLVAVDLNMVEVADWISLYGYKSEHLRKYVRSSLSQNLLLGDIVLVNDASVVLIGGRERTEENEKIVLPEGFLKKVIASAQNSTMHYSSAVLSSSTSQPVWYVARTVSLPNGKLGAVVAELQLDLLSSQLVPANKDANVMLTLEELGQNKLVASYPIRPLEEKRTAPLLDPAALLSGVPFQTQSRIGDEGETLLMARPGFYPGLSVTAGISLRDVYHEWHQEKWGTIGVAALLVALSTLFAWMVTRSLSRMAKAQTDLETTKASLAATLEAVPDNLMEFDADRRCIMYKSGKGRRFFALDEQWRGHLPIEVLPDNVLRQFYDFLTLASRVGYVSGTEIFCSEEEGSWFELSAVQTQSNGMTKIVAVARDITERKRSESQLQLAASVFGHSQEGIMITDAQGLILDVNEKMIESTGYSRADLIGNRPSILKSPVHKADFYAHIWQTIIAQGQWSGEIWNLRKNGQIHPELLTISAVKDAEKTVRSYVAHYTDIEQIKNQQKLLERIAHYDVLTELPNKVHLMNLLESLLKFKNGVSDAVDLAVIYLDLDNFKTLNDKYGHEVGDEVLVHLAKEFMSILGEGELLSRTGGDEFVFVIPKMTSMEASEALLKKIYQLFDESIKVSDLLLSVSVSAGIAFGHSSDQKFSEAGFLLRSAEQAMYVAKSKGRSQWSYYDDESAKVLEIHHEKIRQIGEGFAREEFVLYYQPKANLRTGKIVGAEALIRWQHPTKGLLSPGLFLPYIEDHSLSVDIGEWVILTALKQMREWSVQHGLNLHVSVNVSALQLQQDGFVDRLAQLLLSVPEVDPSLLQIEVLETREFEDLEKVASILNKCKELGVSFALDDFGTGYSSLSYLRDLPIGTLKIDQSFIRDMLKNPNDILIVQSVIGLANVFKRSIVAEGVETLEVGDKLLYMGCELVQGYGIARPMSPQLIPDWIDQWVKHKPT